LCHQLVEPDSPKHEWLIARWGLRDGDGFIAVTETERALLRKSFPTKPVVDGFLPLYDAFPPQRLTRHDARQQLGIASEEPLLLFFGFVRRYKGLRFLVEALGQLSLPVRALIAGEFWEDEQIYRAQIRELGLNQRVIIHNRYIPNEEVEQYFVAADALVLPYLSGSQSAVGMTALYYGLPIITTAVGGLAETVKHGEMGLVVPPADSTALARAIQDFFDGQQNETYRANIAREREHLSWPALVQVINELSHELATSQPTGATHAAHASP
jgi:glycosyltransferase involved in cell wall biosynthesis